MAGNRHLNYTTPHRLSSRTGDKVGACDDTYACQTGEENPLLQAYIEPIQGYAVRVIKDIAHQVVVHVEAIKKVFG